MDLIYMSDAMAYQSVRGSLSYYDSRSWDNKSTKKTQDKYHKSSSAAGKSKGHKSGAGEVCKICQEQRRRTLKSYIRSKSHEEKDGRCIVEEENEEDEEEQTRMGETSGSSVGKVEAPR